MLLTFLGARQQRTFRVDDQILSTELIEARAPRAAPNQHDSPRPLSISLSLARGRKRGMAVAEETGKTKRKAKDTAAEQRCYAGWRKMGPWSGREIKRRRGGPGHPPLHCSIISELPDMMSASEGGGDHGKADVVREAARIS